MSPRAGLDMETIVTAAGELADELGTDQLSLASLAARLGVRSPSLYNHIGGLPELKKALARHGLAQLYEAMRSALDAEADEDMEILAIGRAYVAYARRRPGVYELTLRAPDQNNPGAEEAGRRILGLIMEVIRKRESELEEEELLHTVRGLRSLLHGFASLEQHGGFGMELDRDVTLTKILTAYMAGVRSREQ
ncbi:TetR/AcrR family transcriptional regulator [Paenibacillus sp. CN-4]|uniref:TetR/AcrR family transcriptional regulator n=1 Tax=Paenibacillus nanchangensis TaxID=3348343 RepID=UPI003978893B